MHGSITGQCRPEASRLRRRELGASDGSFAIDHPGCDMPRRVTGDSHQSPRADSPRGCARVAWRGAQGESMRPLTVDVGRIVLFKERNKSNEKAPDLKGACNID